MRINPAPLFLALFLILRGEAQEWPVEFKPPADAHRYSRLAGSPHHFRSATFEIVSFKDHPADTLTALVACAESVPAVLKALPLPLSAPPENGPSRIRIHRDAASYLAGGGAPGTAGYYDFRNGNVLLRWDFLFDRNSPAGRLPEPNFDLVIHELTHLSMHRLIPRIEVWLSEGIAEYLTAAHTGHGHYRFDRIEAAISERIRARHPKSEEPISLPPLANLLKSSRKEWLKAPGNQSAPSILESYDAALLLAHYCIHGGAERRHLLKSHLENAHRVRSSSLILPVTEAPTIEKSLAAFWQKRGLKITFRIP